MDDARYRARGRLAVESARLELLSFTLARTLHGGSYGVFYASANHLSFEQIAALIGRLYATRRLHTEESRQWLIDARAFMKERNSILHGVAERGTTRFINRRSKPFQFELSNEDLEAVSDRGFRITRKR